MIFRPKYITFDCYGTLTNFRMHEVASSICRRPAAAAAHAAVHQGLRRLPAGRGDGRLEALRPGLKSRCARVCKRHGVAYRDEDGRKFYDAVPTWGPHADVPEALRAWATRSRW